MCSPAFPTVYKPTVLCFRGSIGEMVLSNSRCLLTSKAVTKCGGLIYERLYEIGC